MSDSEDDLILIRGTRSFVDIYVRCYATNIELITVEAILRNYEWKKVMLEELKMIEKSETLKLVDRPKDKKFIRVR
jgi:hypothetical protein